MARELLNEFVDTGGQWTSGQPEYFIRSKDESFGANGRDIKIHETARSGCVVLSPVGGDLSSYGDAEVFLTIIYTNGSSEYLSAPLTTSIEFKKVQTLRLNFLFVIGNTGCQSITWRAMVNAHCIYER
jgi:hypothetical protein